MKTEELEKCKLEIKDLRKIINLREQVNLKDDNAYNMEVEEEYEIADLRRMKSKGFDRKSPQADQFQEHKTESHLRMKNFSHAHSAIL